MSFDIKELLKSAREDGVSDIHLKVGAPPVLRKDGKLMPLKDLPPLTSEDVWKAVRLMTNEKQRKTLEEVKGLDIAYELEDVGRHRVNIFFQKGELAVAIRIIPSVIRTIRELNLPPVIERLALEDRGLILVTGVAGMGKSTTLAAMIDYINENKSSRILTIEDPIEYVFTDKKSFISQREVGIDTPSFYQGLKEALRQDPNVIMVGEMRDLETIQTALQAAETGHLVLSTLHTLDAKESINRIISVFPGQMQNEVRIQLSSVLKAVISQRLVPTADGKNRVPAVEIMVTTARIRDMILREERLGELKEAIAEGYIPYGMQTFEQSLFYLWKKGLITAEMALDFATNRENLELRMKGITTDQESRYWKIFEEMALRELGQLPEEDPTTLKKAEQSDNKIEKEIKNLLKELNI